MLTEIALLSTGFWALCVTAALVVLWRRPSRAALERDSRIGKLEGDVDDLFGRVQRLAGKVGRQVRDEKAAETAAEDDESFKQRAGESSAAWKLRTRALIQRGVKPK